MPATTVIAAKNALKDAVEDIASLVASGALVRHGVPTDVPTEDERVYVYRRIENGKRDPELQSRIWQETYDVTIHIEVKTYGNDDGAANEARAYEILDDVEAAVAADDTLAGTAKQAALATFDSDTAPTTDGWMTLLIAKYAVGAITA